MCPDIRESRGHADLNGAGAATSVDPPCPSDRTSRRIPPGLLWTATRTASDGCTATSARSASSLFASSPTASRWAAASGGGAGLRRKRR